MDAKKQAIVTPTRRWAFMRPFDIYAKDGSGDVYLHRLRIVQTPWFAVYLHDLNLPDSDRDPHDHPWTFWSFVLRSKPDLVRVAVEQMLDRQDTWRMQEATSRA